MTKKKPESAAGDRACRRSGGRRDAGHWLARVRGALFARVAWGPRKHVGRRMQDRQRAPLARAWRRAAPAVDGAPGATSSAKAWTCR